MGYPFTYIYIPLANAIARLLAEGTKVTPNQITLSWLFVGILGAYFYSRAMQAKNLNNG
jgi:hypothetical protein